MISELKVLLQGNAEEISVSVSRARFRALARYCLIIVVGAGLYGATLGLWRAPRQSVYTAIKFPLIIFLTCLGNGAINGMLAQILGLGFSFKQTALAILMSFATAAIILAGFAPITLFVWFNAPPLASKNAILGHSVMLLTHVFAIALAGLIANRRLLGLLRKMSGSNAIARAVLFSWLAGNLFLGAQLAWNFRPFIGSPGLAVQFLRDDPLRGNFYEAVWRAFRHLLGKQRQNVDMHVGHTVAAAVFSGNGTNLPPETAASTVFTLQFRAWPPGRGALPLSIFF